jgi:hypothetical protein
MRPLKWRDSVIPIVSRSVGFQHESVKHKFVFRDREYVEALGVRNLTFRYGIPMREDLAKGPYQNLFTKQLPAFMRAFLDRSTGNLRDPVHGTFTAKPVSYNENLDVLRRDGVDLEVEFVQAPEEEELEITGAALSSLQSLTADAFALETAVARVNWLQEVPPESLVNPLDAVNGLLRQGEMVGGQIAAAFDGIAHDLDTIVETVDRLEDPEAWPIRQSAIRMKNSAVRAARELGNPADVIRRHVTTSATTLASVGKTLGMSVREVLGLNPALAAGAGRIDSGTTVLHKDKAA